jgi:hypothetical protein
MYHSCFNIHIIKRSFCNCWTRVISVQEKVEQSPNPQQATGSLPDPPLPGYKPIAGATNRTTCSESTCRAFYLEFDRAEALVVADSGERLEALQCITGFSAVNQEECRQQHSELVSMNRKSVAKFWKIARPRSNLKLFDPTTSRLELDRIQPLISSLTVDW